MREDLRRVPPGLDVPRAQESKREKKRKRKRDFITSPPPSSPFDSFNWTCLLPPCQSEVLLVLLRGQSVMTYRLDHRHSITSSFLLV